LARRLDVIGADAVRIGIAEIAAEGSDDLAWAKPYVEEALADVAEDQGALVLWGRCREDAGAPPYWPWVQILRAYIEASSLDEVRLIMGTATKEIAGLVPELLDASHHPEQNANTLADPGAQRFETRLLGREARGERVDPVKATRAAGELLRGEDARLDPLERPRPAADVDEIEPDSDDHARRAANGILGCVTRRTEGVSAAAIT